MTDDDLRFVRKFPDKCCAEVSRNGEAQPCDKPAVAIADGDAESDSWWPVCPHHSRGRKMVPLATLLSALQPDTDTIAAGVREDKSMTKGVYALKQPHPDGSEWIQEHDSLEDALRYQSHSGGVLVRREQIPGKSGL